MDNRIFVYSLVGSFFIHSAILISLSVSKAKALSKPFKKMDIAYQLVKPKPAPKVPQEHKDVKLVKDSAPLRNFMIPSKKLDDTMLSKDIKDIVKMKSDVSFDKRVLPSVKVGEFEKKIVIPLPQSEKMTDTKYFQYQNEIRSKIQAVADRYADGLDLENGEVFITFILAADGRLKDLKVLDYRSSADDHQKELGRRFIREANPFPRFPQDYRDFPELPFNITISFQIKKVD